MQRLLLIVVGLLAGIAAAGPTFAHGFAGKRFFPATLATDDPFVADELSLPTVSRRTLASGDGSPGPVETSMSIDFAKRITSNLGIELGANYLSDCSDGDVQKGFDNLAAGVKYQFHKSDEHESIASFGVDWDIGGTGARRVGADSFSTFTPAIFFGKGLGELPEGAKWLRPLAMTGVAGVAIPRRAGTTAVDESGNGDIERHPHVLHLGLAIEYSIPYLQSFVKDVGLGAPFNHLVPVVEFDLQKPVDRGAGPWTGTVNPGLLWAGRFVQLGLEAVAPVNSRTGGGTGVLFQLHFFLDDLFPRTMGKPLL